MPSARELPISVAFEDAMPRNISITVKRMDTTKRSQKAKRPAAIKRREI
jgi:hypothetical protein